MWPSTTVRGRPGEQHRQLKTNRLWETLLSLCGYCYNNGHIISSQRHQHQQAVTKVIADIPTVVGKHVRRYFRRN